MSHRAERGSHVTYSREALTMHSHYCARSVYERRSHSLLSITWENLTSTWYFSPSYVRLRVRPSGTGVMLMALTVQVLLFGVFGLQFFSTSMPVTKLSHCCFAVMETDINSPQISPSRILP